MYTATLGAPISALPQAKRPEYRSIVATPLSPHIGAEIGDVDLTRPLSPEQIAEIKDAFNRYQVIFFRNQQISHEDQIRFAGLFGPLGKHVGANTISKPTENPLVRKFHYDHTSDRVSGENWHSDQSCAPMPPLGSMLYLHTIPPDGGGDTMFASTCAAYDALSDRMKTFLLGLTATHDGTRVFGRERRSRRTRSSSATRRAAAAASSSAGTSPATSTGYPVPRVTRSSASSTAISGATNGRAASAGSRTRSRSGTTGVRNTRRYGITGPTSDPAPGTDRRHPGSVARLSHRVDLLWQSLKGKNPC
jgi:hypothetical protein